MDIKWKSYHQNNVKIITNGPIYNINYLIYKGKIRHILLLKDKKKIVADSLDFEEIKLETNIEEQYLELAVEQKNSPQKWTKANQLHNRLRVPSSIITTNKDELEEGEIIEPEII